MTTGQRQITIQICPDCGREYDGDLEYCPEDGTRLRALGLSSDSDEDDPLLGAEIDGRFHVESVLGEGGMGKVYRGKQLSVHRDVAIKVLHSKLASEEMLVKRFFREAQVISKFSHPNIVQLVDFGRDEENDVLYLAMEYIDGTELSELVEESRLTVPFAVEIVCQACEALSEPHSNGVVHRDLKPENLMLVPTSSGKIQAKVVDFGIAHALQSNTKLTKTGMVFGTAHYMAPEQASGEDVDAATDIYALGCIFFELLSGRLPFEGDQPMQLLMSHVKEPPPLLERMAPGDEQFRPLSKLIRRMMNKSAQDRPDSVLEVRDRLEEIQRQQGHPPLRVDGDVEGEQMFEPWLKSPFSAEAADAAKPEAADAAKGDIDAGVEGPSNERSGETQTAARPVLEQQESTGAREQTPSVAQSGADRSLLIPAVGMFVAALAMSGMVAFMFLNDSEQADDESPPEQQAGQPTAEAAGEQPDQPDETPGSGGDETNATQQDEQSGEPAEESEQSDQPDEASQDPEPGDQPDEAPQDPEPVDEPTEPDEPQPVDEPDEPDEPLPVDEPDEPVDEPDEPTEPDEPQPVDEPDEPDEPVDEPDEPPEPVDQPDEPDEQNGGELEVFPVD